MSAIAYNTAELDASHLLVPIEDSVHRNDQLILPGLVDFNSLPQPVQSLQPVFINSTNIIFNNSQGYFLNITGLGFKISLDINDSLTFANFQAGLEAGIASGTISSILFGCSNINIFSISISNSIWEFQSGIQKISIVGVLPNSLNVMDSLIIGLKNNAYTPEQINSQLFGYHISQLKIDTGDVASTITINLSENQISVCSRNYTLNLVGDFPFSFGDILNIIMSSDRGDPSYSLQNFYFSLSNFDIKSATITNNLNGNLIYDFTLGVDESRKHLLDWVDSAFGTDGSADVKQLINSTNADMAISGTSGDDIINSNVGSKSIDGGAGTNTVVFSDAQPSFRIGTLGGTTIVSSNNVYDKLTNIQDIQFSDGSALGVSSTVTDELVAVNKSGVASCEMPDIYSGPVNDIQYQYLGEAVADIVAGTSKNDFLNVGGGDDAVNGGAGSDVLDGGTGSNFLTGGSGWDTFFIDGRGNSTTWGTITDYTLAQLGTPNEQVSIWGWVPGTSSMSWVANDGAQGYQGATLVLDMHGDGSLIDKVTFTGLTQSHIPTPVEFTPAQTGGAGLLWFK